MFKQTIKSRASESFIDPNLNQDKRIDNQLIQNPKKDKETVAKNLIDPNINQKPRIDTGLSGNRKSVVNVKKIEDSPKSNPLTRKKSKLDTGLNLK